MQSLCKIGFPKYKAERMALNFYIRGFLFSALPAYLGSPISLHPCPVKLTRGGGMLSFCTLHRSPQLKRHFHNMWLKVCSIALEKGMRDVWGYKAFWNTPGGLQRGARAKPGVMSSFLRFGNSPWCKVSEALPRHCLEDLVSHAKVMNHVNS